MKIAITGGIGSGKSYICNIIGKHGISIYDCDSAAKRIIKESPEIRRQLTELIGNNAYTDNGKINKTVMTSFLLKSETNTNAINSIVHPAVADDFIQSGYKWMECAILYESGFDKLVDKVIAVTAPLDIRIERIMKRDGITRSKALEWIKKQIPQEDIVERADYVIINDGNKDLSKQINNIIKLLLVL
ncbi:dephospho-CoA kinase [Xylanibacter muris]|uniref:Dephospho-CoA kinase n=1 Tax=Xylanibacter muris TaxID=2736290 RepID=A0ABX2ARU8_9BACT|nr:dephospho-CoA kinase [Xylanibacter muris]NPD92950.1 dephospho-CoA kinase [Xylanibacter muris]